MTKTKVSRFDPAEYLQTPEDVALYLDEYFAGGDVDEITKALGDVARSKGMAEIARQTGLGRESLYKALNVGGNPEFATILKVLKALGLQMKVEASVAA
jgi:probable addiction module antidote protein